MKVYVDLVSLKFVDVAPQFQSAGSLVAEVTVYTVSPEVTVTGAFAAFFPLP